MIDALALDNRRSAVTAMDERDARAAAAHWDDHFAPKAHPGQLPPEGDWLVWLLMGGRGFGKTRAGAEWVRSIVESDPCARFALVAASLGEARSVMVEGESGLIACAPDDNRPVFEPSLHRLRWPGGAQAFLYSAAEPESLRGPQHSHARRTGSEGVLCQRSILAHRQPAPRSCGRIQRHTTGKPI